MGAPEIRIPALLIAACLWVLAFPTVTHAQPRPEPASTVNFDRDVWPILLRHCVKCHEPRGLSPVAD